MARLDETSSLSFSAVSTRQWRHLGWAVFALVAGLRLIYCLQLPVNTNDILRHAVYGLEVLDRGLAAADQPLVELSPQYRPVAWSRLPFNYPVMLLGFDVLVMWVWPTFFAFKAALTLVDLACAALVALYTKDRRLGLLYWALPSFVWWTSHEGQLDGLQNLPILAALCLVKRRPIVAWALVVVAVQSKLFAIFLVPWLAYETLRPGSRTWSRSLGFMLFGGLLGSLPTLVATAFFSPIRNLFRSQALTYNPYFWDVTAREMFLWNPPWLILGNQLASYGLLIALGFLLTRQRDLALTAPLFFLTALKLSGQGQFWYLLVLPALMVPVAEPKARRLLLLSLPLLDLRSLVQIVFGPFGFQIGDRFGSLTTLTEILVAGSPPI